jgi:hypothetical protein
MHGHMAEIPAGHHLGRSLTRQLCHSHGLFLRVHETCFFSVHSRNIEHDDDVATSCLYTKQRKPDENKAIYKESQLAAAPRTAKHQC